MLHIAVFFGGKSNEREISVITGVYAVNLLRGAGYDVIPVYLNEENAFLYEPKLRRVDDALKGGDEIFFVRGGFALRRKPKRILKVDCALNCCHGGLGEGGGLSALLELYNIPSASPGACGSALFIDKDMTKIVLRGMGIPTVPSVTLTEGASTENYAEKVAALGYPIILKPALLGSSIGITVVNAEGELKGALQASFALCKKVVAEKYLRNKRDLNCAAYRMGEEVVLSPVEEVFSTDQILSFKEKYESAERRSAIPAEISEVAASAIGEYLRRIYEQFDMRGIVRADFLLSGEDLYFNELNTVPGSLALYLFGDGLMHAKELITRLIDNAMKSSPEKEIVSSGILTRTPTGFKSRK